MLESTGQHAENPISAALCRIAALDAYVQAEVGSLETGWVRAVDLADPQLPYLQQGLERITAIHPGIDPLTKGAFFIGDYAWNLTAAAIGTYLVEGRVPDFAAENVGVCFRTETFEEDGKSFKHERIDIRFLSEQSAALTPYSQAIILPDLPALREWLRLRLESHLAPLIRHTAKLTKLGQRAQWSLVADSCASAFLHMGKLLKVEDRARIEGMAFVKAAGSPMDNPYTGYISLEAEGSCDTFLTRGGCCRYYTLPGADKCSSCVLRPAEERSQMLLKTMIQH